MRDEVSDYWSPFILHPSALIPALQRDADGLHYFEEHRLGFFAASHRRGITRADRKTVRKDRDHESLDIVRETVASFFSEGERLSRAKKRERATRTDTQIQHLGRARRGHNLHQIVDYSVVD